MVLAKHTSSWIGHVLIILTLYKKQLSLIVKDRNCQIRNTTFLW